MKKKLFVLSVVLAVLLVAPIVSTAEAPGACNGLMSALENIPADSPGYAKVLDMAQTKCGAALDLAALIALYEATDGDNWTKNDYWLEQLIPHCQWYGVTCDVEGRVQKLELIMNNLKGPIPTALGNLSNLDVLDVRYSYLDGPIPAELGNLSNLEVLDLLGNSLDGPIPAELGNLSNLEHLRLSVNPLSGPIPDSLGNLPNLISVSLFANGLTGPIPDSLGNLSNLESLNLSYNYLTGTIPDSLRSLSKLHTLLLDHNPWAGTGPGLECWETTELFEWAQSVQYGAWDDPPGTTVCPSP